MENIIYIDNLILRSITAIRSDLLTEFMLLFSFLGSFYFYFIVCLVIFIKKMPKRVYFTVNLVILSIINNIVKAIFRRSRPFIYSLIYQSGYSFPSGHAMLSIYFYGYLIFMVNRYNFPYRKVIIYLLSTLIVLISFSRIYLGVHYLSDIIIGILLGFIFLKYSLKHGGM